MFSNIHKVAQIMCGVFYMRTLCRANGHGGCVFYSDHLNFIQSAAKLDPGATLPARPDASMANLYLCGFYICILFLLGSACPFRLVDLSVCQARYTKRPSALIFLLLCTYLQRALTL